MVTRQITLIENLRQSNIWIDEALDDLEEILAYHYAESGPRTAEAVERRIVEQVEGAAAVLRADPENRCGRRAHANTGADSDPNFAQN